MKPKILVVDDEASHRKMIEAVLSDEGYEIKQADDGQAAIDAAQRLRPDLVLMDITMPVIGGLEALRQIRSLLPDIKVVMLTVSEDDSDLFEAIRVGANGYLLKNLRGEACLFQLGKWFDLAEPVARFLKIV